MYFFLYWGDINILTKDCKFEMHIWAKIYFAKFDEIYCWKLPELKAKFLSPQFWWLLLTLLLGGLCWCRGPWSPALTRQIFHPFTLYAMGRAVRPHLSFHNSSRFVDPLVQSFQRGLERDAGGFPQPFGWKTTLAQTTETDTPTHGYENLNVSCGLQMFNSTAFG